MLLTLQLKLVPSDEQKVVLLKTMEQYNASCNYISEVAFESRTFGKVGLQKLVYYDVKDRFGLSAQMVVRAIGKVSESYKVDRKTQHEFKPHGAIQYDQRNLTFKTMDTVSILTLEKREKINFVCGNYRELDLERVKGQADLVYRDNQFYLLIVCDVPEEEPINSERVIGIDLGIVNLATTSEGRVFSGDACKKVRQKYQKTKSALQSVGTWDAKKHLKKLSKRERRFKKDTNHCISKDVVQYAKGTLSSIALEDLSGIRDKVTVRKAQREEHSKWAFGELSQFIKYKAQLAGVLVYLVDPRNTSRQCSECGYIDKKNRKSQSEFVCKSCNHTENADINAAKNIAQRAAVNQPIALCSSERLKCKPTVLTVGY